MSHCHEMGSHSLVFALKRPPKLETMQVPVLGSNELLPVVLPVKSRAEAFAGVQGSQFGQCRGIKLCISHQTIDRLKKHESFRDLVRFGVLQQSDTFVRDIYSQRVGPDS